MVRCIYLYWRPARFYTAVPGNSAKIFVVVVFVSFPLDRLSTPLWGGGKIANAVAFRKLAGTLVWQPGKD